MRFDISRHTAGNVGLVQIVPERPSGKLLPNLRDDVGIQQRSHVRGSQKTFQHFRVHGQQLRAAFGLRHVVLVHIDAFAHTMGDRIHQLAFHRVTMQSVRMRKLPFHCQPDNGVRI